MLKLKRLKNILIYGLGDKARAKKQAAKSKARDAKFDSKLWQKNDGLAKRQYDSYEDYLDHQSSKLDRVKHRLDETYADDLAEFRRRFSLCCELKGRRSILCLGARIGTEVQALHDLGYFAVGIDLNPGPESLLVLKGDFHALQFPDGSVDAVYTNCLDHVFDLPRMMREIERVLRPGGIFVADVLPGFEEGWTPGNYEAAHWPRLDVVIDAMTEAAAFKVAARRDMGQHRRDPWTQVVLERLETEGSGR